MGSVFVRYFILINTLQKQKFCLQNINKYFEIIKSLKKILMTRGYQCLGRETSGL